MTMLHNSILRIAILALTISSMSSCARADNKTATPLQQPAVAIASDIPEELPLPILPDSLKTAPQRADYLILHFWDALDFNDTVRSLDTDFVEQNFANFVNVFPHATPSGVNAAVTAVLSSASSNEAAYRLMLNTADRYLYDPNSPMLNEEFYAVFLNKAMADPSLDESMRERFEYQLGEIAKNARGTIATNFSYTDREGSNHTLHSTPVDAGQRLLLIFYDPDCDTCHGLMDKLRENPLDNTKVLVVCIEGTFDDWKASASELPAQWTAGYAGDTIDSEGLYSLRALPTVYLLDADKRVIVKDALF